MVVVPALWVLRAPAPAMAQAAVGPWWLWIGGVLGAIYVASAAAVTPRLGAGGFLVCVRSEEHTSELQSPCNIVCRLLLEKKTQENAPLDIAQLARAHSLLRFTLSRRI